MVTQEVSIGGVVYPFAPMEPVKAVQPTPAYPVTVTPQIARHWMTYNHLNRNTREVGQRDYSTDMREGDFALNGTTITFTRPYEEGEHEDVPAGHVTVLDGQHRLLSCIRAGKPFVVYVAYGFDPRVRHTVDTGIKRKLSDVLQLRGEKESNVLSSVIARCYAWETGDKRLMVKKGGVTYTRYLEFFAQHPEVRRSAEIAGITRREFKAATQVDLRQSTTGTMHWVLTQHDPQYTLEFFARIGDGDQLRVSDPITHLRRRLIRDQTVKKQLEGTTRKELVTVPGWHHVCYFIRTFNARRIWDYLPESMQDDFKFLLIGRDDHKEIPAILTDEEVLKDVEIRIRRAERTQKDEQSA